MKLISDFKDYYDGCLSLDVEDQDTTYLRNRKKYVEKSFTLRSLPYRISSPIDTSLKILGFCGDIYPIIARKTYGDPPEFFYISIANHAEEFLKKYCNNAYYNFYMHTPNQVQEVVEYCQKTLKNMFKELGAPVFLYEVYASESDITVNPTLKDINFQKIKDPYTAFQDIRMYLENTAKQETPVNIPTGSDEILAASKGYDKLSFRSEARNSKRVNRKHKCN
jgi:hypothetical protein